MSELKKSVRFDLLDGLRGLAAIGVMIYHYTQHNGLNWLPGAWVAVDLFFILSGFVLHHSYANKINRGMSLRDFLFIRLIRLGPLYFIGWALGLTAALIVLSNEFSPLATPAVIKAAILGLIWFPYLNNLSWPFGSDMIHGPIFPLNDPAWSLFFELFVNIVFFFYLYTTKSKIRVKFVLYAFAVFISLTFIFHQYNPGWGKVNFIFGFPRVIFEFFAGALIYSLGYHKRKISFKFTALVILLGLFGIFSENYRINFINSIVLMPALVILLSSLSVEGNAKKICQKLGELSYPLYIIHFPVFRLMYELTSIKNIQPVLQTLLMSTVSIALAFMFIYVDHYIRTGILRFTSYRASLQPLR